MVAIDFEKTFDSVDRVALIRALMYYKRDPRLIDVVWTCMWDIEQKYGEMGYWWVIQR